jgi:hypothetical protein
MDGEGPDPLRRGRHQPLWVRPPGPDQPHRPEWQARSYHSGGYRDRMPSEPELRARPCQRSHVSLRPRRPAKPDTMACERVEPVAPVPYALNRRISRGIPCRLVSRQGSICMYECTYSWGTKREVKFWNSPLPCPDHPSSDEPGIPQRSVALKPHAYVSFNFFDPCEDRAARICSWALPWSYWL